MQRSPCLSDSRSSLRLSSVKSSIVSVSVAVIVELSFVVTVDVVDVEL